MALEAGRLSAANRPDAPDLHGGFVLSSKLTADSQTARAAAATTEMLGDDRLVPAAERAEAIDRAGDTIRFLMQLVTTDEMGWSYRRPDRVVGGIRTSMWDRDLAPAAQAMTLIALSEWLEATSDTP